jgi:hypothetical protein
MLSGLVVMAGCLEYTTVRVDRVPAGESVRVEVSPEAVDRLRMEEEGEPLRSGRRITGEWLGVDAGSVTLAVRVPTGSDQFNPGTVMFRRVAVGIDDILAVQVKRVNRTRTALTALGVGAVLAAAIWPYMSGEFGGTTKPTPASPLRSGATLRVRPVPFGGGP